LWINRSTTDYVGLFGYTSDATIKNLGVEITAAGIKGKNNVGGLLGYLNTTNSGISSIENCYATGNVIAEYNNAGGLAGSTSGNITRCYATGNVTASFFVGGLVGNQFSNSSISTKSSNITNCYATGNVLALGNDAGGLVGYQRGLGADAEIINCYATGDIRANRHAGGLVGYQEAISYGSNRITSCYATGHVAVFSNDAGGLVGYQIYTNSGRNYIANSYRYINVTILEEGSLVSVTNSTSGVHGGIKTATELKNKSTYTGNGWRFVDTHPILGTWHWDSRGFPKLNIGSEGFSFRLPSFSEGEGTSVSPFIITSPAQLDEVRNYRSSHYKLGNDIVLTAYLSSGGAGYAKWGTAGWQPIGNSTSAFYGNFDGNGKKIIGLRINRSTTNYVGLFGYTSGAVIKNLGVEIAAAGINGKDFVGGLLGYQYTSNNGSGSISNCYVSGNVTAVNDVGGLVGVTTGNIANCYATGNVTANTSAGGLVGAQRGTNSKIANCYVTSNVLAVNQKAGGLVGCQGALGADNEITNCYATGNITAADRVGGLVGSQENNSSTNIIIHNRIKNCYATGNVTATGDNARGLVGYRLSYSNGTNDIANSYRYVNAIIKARGNLVSAANSTSGLHGGTKKITELKSKSTYTGNGWLFNDSYPAAGPWRWDLSGFPKLNIGDERYPFNIFAGGDGSPFNPFIITSAEQLDEVRSLLSSSFKLSNDIDLTGYLSPGISLATSIIDRISLDIRREPISPVSNSGSIRLSSDIELTSSLPADISRAASVLDKKSSELNLTRDIELIDQGANIELLRLSRDIELISSDIISGPVKISRDMELVEALIEGAGYAKWGASGWLPIGDAGNRFSGIFDGNGKKITGLWINRAATDYVGLFGNASNTAIANLGVVIDNSKGGVKGKDYVGGLVGLQESNGWFNNCYTTGNVTATGSYAGGVAGSTAGNFTNCYAAGNVTAFWDAGGVAGNISGYFANSYATGNVTAYSRAGGVAGILSGSLTNCYATGNISADIVAGGLVGFHGAGAVKNCYSTGDVTATNSAYVGALAGYLSASGSSIENSYRYQLVKVNGALRVENMPNGKHGGAKTAAELKNKSTYTGNGWLFNDSSPTVGPWHWDNKGFPKLNMGSEAYPFPFP